MRITRSGAKGLMMEVIRDVLWMLGTASASAVFVFVVYELYLLFIKPYKEPPTDASFFN